MTDRSASGRAPARQEPDDSHKTVATLLEERSKYQAWIDALDARRDSSPDHVFRRVRSDYEKRLADVATQLEKHLPALRETVGTLTDKIVALHADEARLRDERAEAELRAAVGELAGARWEKAARTHDEGIAKVVARRSSLEAELEVVEELVASARDSIEMAAIPQDDASGAESDPASAERAEPEPPVRDELEFLRSLTGAGGPAAEAALAAKRAREAASSAQVVSSPKVKAESGARAPAPADESTATRESATEAETETAASAVPASNPAPRDPDAISADESPDKESDAADRGDKFFDPTDDANPLRDLRTAERPLGASTGGDSLVLRADSSQPKTLKCVGCGTMNFPTEWYCERCGAELAEL